MAVNAGVGAAKARFFPTLSLTGLFGNVSPELGNIFLGKDLEPLRRPGGPDLRRRPDQEELRGGQGPRRAGQGAVRGGGDERAARGVGGARGPHEARGGGAATGARGEGVLGSGPAGQRTLPIRPSAYFQVLDAQKELFPAEISLVQTHRDQLLAVVNLYKALGGGWPSHPGLFPTDAAPSPFRVFTVLQVQKADFRCTSLDVDDVESVPLGFRECRRLAICFSEPPPRRDHSSFYRTASSASRK